MGSLLRSSPAITWSQGPAEGKWTTVAVATERAGEIKSLHPVKLAATSYCTGEFAGEKIGAQGFKYPVQDLKYQKTSTGA